jgi:F-type H+-transporting ATPase subunit b
MDLTPVARTILFQIVNFLVLAWLLHRFLFRPMMTKVKERAGEKERLAQELARDHEAAVALRAELEARLAHADEEVDGIIAHGQEEATELRKAMLRETESEVARILSEAHAEAQRLQQQAIKASQTETLDAILEISARLIGRSAPPELHQQLVQQMSDRIWEMGRSEMQRVEEFRRSLGTRSPTAYVTTALPLSPDQQGLLARTFTALADRNVNLELRTDPDLAAGARVRLGDMVIDNSIAGELRQLRQDTLDALNEVTGDE